MPNDKKCVYCNKVRSKFSDLSFHHFPTDNPVLLREWLEDLSLPSDFKILPSHVLCSDHFNFLSFERSFNFSASTCSRRLLKKGAVPTLGIDRSEPDGSEIVSHRCLKRSSLPTVNSNDRSACNTSVGYFQPDYFVPKVLSISSDLVYMVI